MTAALLAAAALAGSAAWLGTGRRREAARRLSVLTAARPEVPVSPAAGGSALRPVAAAAAGAAVLLLVPAPAGVLAGPVAAVLLHRWLSRLRPLAEVRLERRVAAALPLALDLLVACLRAGLPVHEAVAVTARAADPALAARLAPVLRAHELGAGPVDAWRACADDPVLGPVARALARAGRTGAGPAAAVAALAAQQRESAAARAEEAARAVGVWAALPLVCCFLPAFVLVGVVPVVWGLLRTLL